MCTCYYCRTAVKVNQVRCDVCGSNLYPEKITGSVYVDLLYSDALVSGLVGSQLVFISVADKGSVQGLKQLRRVLFTPGSTYYVASDGLHFELLEV